MSWKHALMQEQYVHRVLFNMAQHGWDVDAHKVQRLMQHCANRIASLDSEIMPLIPNRVIPDGVPILKPFKKDGTPSQACIKRLEEDISYLWGPFCCVKFEPVNLGSDKQLKEYLFSVGWEPDEWNYNKKTKETTSAKLTESSLESLAGVDAKGIKERIQASHRLSQLEGWLSGVRPDGRLPMIISGITPTYRAKHRVIVNVPGGDAYLGKEMRSCFVAKPGYKMIGIDSKSNQLRMLCHYMKDDSYTAAVVHGRQEDKTDIHSVNQKIAGLPTRAKAKPFIYGLLFGAQDAKLGKIVGGGEKDGARLRATFMRGLPAYARMIKQIEGFWANKKYLLGLDGRLLRPRAKHMLLVYLLQGAEAIYMKVTLAFIQRRGEREDIDFQLVGFIHDELQYMVKDEDTDRFSALALKAFKDAGEYLKLSVPMEGDLKVGLTWGDTH